MLLSVEIFGKNPHRDDWASLGSYQLVVDASITPTEPREVKAQIEQQLADQGIATDAFYVNVYPVTTFQTFETVEGLTDALEDRLRNAFYNKVR